MFRHNCCIAAVLLLLSSPDCSSAGVLGGTVQSVRGNQITVEYGREGKVRAFAIPVAAKVFAGEVPADLTALEPGVTVSVYTTVKGVVYKVRVRSGGRPTGRPGRKPDVSRVIPEIRPSRPGEAPALDEEEWTQFRGLFRANRSMAKGLVAEWPDGGPRAAVVYRGLGAGYSSVSFSKDKLFTMGTRDSDEIVFAFDRDDPSRPMWSTRNGRLYQDGTGDGPRGTPTVDGEFVYSLGARGDLTCIAVGNGEVKWRKNVLQEFAGTNITWGISESPLVDGDRVVVTPGGQTATIAALEKTTGRTLWRSVVPGNPQAAYASAIVCQVGPVRQYVNFTSKGVVGVHAETGTPLWGDDASSNGTANCPSPIFHQSGVFSASGYGTGGAYVRLAPGRNTVQAKLAYKVKEMVNHHGGMVLVDGYVYGTNDNALLCVDIANGDVLWRDRSVGKGSVTYAEGHLYVVGEKGEIALVEANPEEYVEKGRFEHVNRSDKPLWAHPVVHGGLLYVRDQETITAYDIAARD